MPTATNVCEYGTYAKEHCTDNGERHTASRKTGEQIKIAYGCEANQEERTFHCQM
jgi:hypothetical protein